MQSVLAIGSRYTPLRPSYGLLFPGVTACGSSKAVVHEDQDNEEETDLTGIRFSSLLEQE